MPELPEVETLKRELSRALVGKVIKKFESEKFKLDLAGRKILSVDRRAKILIFELAKSQKLIASSYLLIHLKMTGQLVFKPAKHTRAIFTFTDNSKLFFNDLRKFGWLRLANETELQKLFKETGVEPLGKDFTLEKFSEILRRYPKRRIKQLLLDQTLIAGLGNIYVDESLFLAGARPTRITKSLTAAEIKKLRAGIIAVLKLAIKKKGASARDYLRSDGQPGGMVPFLNVYGRGQEICKVCNALVAKIKLNGRGTHYCPRCQK